MDRALAQDKPLRRALLLAGKWFVARSAALLLLLSMVEYANADMMTMNFERLRHEDTQVVILGTHYEQDGYVLRSSGSRPDGLVTLGTLHFLFPGETSIRYVGGGESLSLTSANSLPFDFFGIDIATSGGAPASFTVTGFLASGGTVVSEVSITNEIRLQTFRFTGFENVHEVQIFDASGGQYDNIIVSSAAVLPTPFAAFTAKLKIERGPRIDDTFALQSTFTLGAGSDGIDLSHEDVTLKLTQGTASFATTIPARSFIKDKQGRFTFTGTINGVSLEATMTPQKGQQFAWKVEGEHADLTGIANPVTVTLTIGDDRGSTIGK